MERIGMTYKAYILAYLEKLSHCTPIYTNQIAEAVAEGYGIDRKKAASATAVAVKRIIDDGDLPDLRCFQKGIYYRTTVTPFGEAGIDLGKLIADKYLLPDIGYESGMNLLHRMGLTTQVPNDRLIVTNAAKDCIRYDSRLDISICPPRTPVSAKNKAYLQTLDAIDLLDKAPVDVQDPYKVIAAHIKENDLQYETLLYFADRFYNQKTIIRIAHTAGLKGDEI